MKMIKIPCLLRHTVKAIKKGEPAGRIYGVVDVTEDGYLVAWKHTELPNGKIEHCVSNQFPGELDPTDPSLFIKDKTAKGSEATAIFKYDSFYEPY